MYKTKSNGLKILTCGTYLNMSLNLNPQSPFLIPDSLPVGHLAGKCQTDVTHILVLEILLVIFKRVL